MNIVFVLFAWTPFILATVLSVVWLPPTRVLGRYLWIGVWSWTLVLGLLATFLVFGFQVWGTRSM